MGQKGRKKSFKDDVKRQHDNRRTNNDRRRHPGGKHRFAAGRFRGADRLPDGLIEDRRHTGDTTEDDVVKKRRAQPARAPHGRKGTCWLE